MAREFAQVKVSIWQDSDFRSLPPGAQHLYFVLLTSSTLSYCGIADWRPKRIAASADGWTAASVEKAAAVLQGRLYVVVDESTEEILIRSFVRNDGLMKQPRMAVSMANAYASTASRLLRGVVIHELVRLHRDHPELSGWGKSQARDLLEMPVVDPAGLALANQRFGGGVTPGLGETLPNVSGLPTPSPSPSPYSRAPGTPKFDEFWQHYPKRTGKDAAKRAWAKAVKRVDADLIIAGVIRYAADPNLPERQYIPDPGTWLNAGRWDDEPFPDRSSGNGQQRIPKIYDAVPGQMAQEY